MIKMGADHWSKILPETRSALPPILFCQSNTSGKQGNHGYQLSFGDARDNAADSAGWFCGGAVVVGVCT
jgi:hypothetical protein